MAQHDLTRRELLTSGVMGSVAFGGVAEAGSSPAQPDASEERHINETLKSLVTELQRPAHSMLPADMGPIGRLREQMIEFMRGTNKWPDFIDVGYGVWFLLYDWHVRFGVPPAVTRLPDNRYGLTFMFTMVVLRPEQTVGYMSLPYDKER
jgi:hypothetical protein